MRKRLIHHQIVVGIDFGRNRDFTALSTVEILRYQHDTFDRYSWDPIFEHIFRVRQLYRFPLRTPYDRIVDRLDAYLRKIPTTAKPTLALDATGPGLPLYDILRSQRLPAKLFPISITAGHQVVKDREFYKVPRSKLLTQLHTILRNKGIKISKGIRLAPAFFRELGQLHLDNTPAGYQTIDHPTSEHDDLVVATAMAAFAANYEYERSQPRGTRPLPWIYPQLTS